MTRVVLAILLLAHTVFGPVVSLREARQATATVAREACVCSEGVCACCCCETCPMPEAPAPRSGPCRCTTPLATLTVVAAQPERKRDPPVRREQLRSRGPANFAQRIAGAGGLMTPTAAVADHPHASIVWTGRRTT